MTLASKTAIFKAIDDGDDRMVGEILVAMPSLLHEQGENGLTPLMRAVSSMERTSRLVQTLLDAGADVNTKTDEGYTALHLMVDVNGPTGTGATPGQIARLLVNAGADLEVRQHWGWTALMRAAVEGTPDELQALVNVGGDVNHSFPADTLPEFLGGRTTLMATIGYPAKTKILIDAGANLSATDARGQSVLEYARQCLAEAGEDGADMPQIMQEIFGAAMAETLKQMHDAGIDPDTPIDGTGTTLRQSMEATMADRFVHAHSFNYAAEVRKSIRLLEEALAGR